MKIESKNPRIFITTILPEHLISKYKLSFAACNFSFSLISGGAFDKVYSILPHFVSGGMEKDAFVDNRFDLLYSKLRECGGTCKRLAVLFEQCLIFMKIPKGAFVWFYNINTLNVLLFVLLKVLKPNVKLCVIVLDYTPVSSGFGLNNLFLKLINIAHGRICLSNSQLFDRKNSIVLPGVVPILQEELPLLCNPRMKFLLSGALNEVIAQTSTVLEAFSKMPEYELHITGNQNVELVRNYADKYSNIFFHGQLVYEDYFALLDSITFQLSTRNASCPENQCNFPSKIIEALLHNRAVVSTIRYPQLAGIQYFYVSSSIDGFIQDIRAIGRLGKTELMRYTNQSDKVRTMFSTDVWYKTMNTIEQA